MYFPDYKKSIMLFIITAPFLGGIGIDLYVPSLPTIKNEFNVDQSLVQFTITTYLLGYAIGQLFLGILSDSFGRKKILYFSSIFYIFTTILAIISSDIYFLNLSRFLQGLAIGGIISVGRAIATDSFTGLNLNKAMNYLSLSWSLGPILGPFIGGYLQYFFNWRADFYFFAFYGLFILIIALKLPQTNKDIVEFHPLKILKTIKFVSTHLVFAYGCIILSLIYSILVIFNITGPFLIQDVLKYSVVDYGLISLILGVGYFLGNLVSRFLIHYFHPMDISLVAFLGSVAISLLMVFLDYFIPINLSIILIPTIILFFLIGLIFPNIMAKVLALFPQIAGTASAIFGFLLASGYFVISSLTTLLKTDTPLPTSMTYALIEIICLTIFFFSKKFQKS